MGEFLDRLKKFMQTDEELKEVHQIQGYYETILQHKGSLEKMIAHCEDYQFDFQYEKDESKMNRGKIIVYLCEHDNEEEWLYDIPIDYHYIINLEDDDRDWGYCQCTPEDKLYNPIYKCCGNGCDWTAPRITIEKVENILCEEFDGIERDMWELKVKWENAEQKTEEEIKREQNELQLTRIKQQIEQLQNRQRELESELTN
ncbi:hypothetical protein ACU3L3_07560 [Priestia endophytica]